LLIDVLDLYLTPYPLSADGWFSIRGRFAERGRGFWREGRAKLSPLSRDFLPSPCETSTAAEAGAGRGKGKGWG